MLITKHVIGGFLKIRQLQSLKDLYGFNKKEISTTAVRYNANSLAKFKNLQAFYQVEDGRPIWLKAGLRDRLLYTLVVVLCWVGMYETTMSIWELAKPASWKVKA